VTNGTVECANCHTPVPQSSRFCLSCGADLSGGGGPPSTATVAALQQRMQRLVEGKYKIERMLGKGGMGTVFLAHDLTLEREVAIKVLPPDIAQDDQVVRRFQQEAKTAAKLDHPNIIPIYRVESEGGLNYFVMKYISGTSLEDVLEKREPLSPDYIQRVLWEAACALGHAHSRAVVHRDVKPANIMFDHDGRVMLTDFGISKALQAATGFTATGMIIGTPHYMSPEQAKGQAVDGRADEYSLGIVGYRMITVALPFSGDSVHTILYKHIFEPPPLAKALRADAPDQLSTAIARAMAKDPGERFATMEAFATAVWPEQPVIAAVPVRPRPTTRPAPRARSDAGATPDAATEVSGAPTTPMPAARGTPRRSRTGLIIGLGVTAVAGVGAYLVFGTGTASVPPSQQTAPAPEPRVDTVRVADTVRVPATPVRPERRKTVAPPPTPEAQQGFLTVNADPYGEVYVDGVDVGPTPIVRYAVPPGAHTVKVVREGYRSVTERVQVDAGNTVPKRYTLIPGG